MNAFVPTNCDAPPISDPDQLKSAVERLTSPYCDIGVNRRLCDPLKCGEPHFALFSFVKASDAVADKDGFFGVAKIRGAFYTEKEAQERAELLVRDVDSTNSIHTCVIGVPFPLVTKGFSKELSEVDLKQKVEGSISANVKARRLEEQREMEEMNARREKLMKDEGKIEEEAPENRYVQQRVKLAHLRYAIVEHETQLKKCKELEKSTRQHLNECRARNPEFEDNYIENYKRGRRSAHISEDTDLEGFMKYFADPIDPIEEVSYIS